ncbi:hypothetical protein CTAYLR_009071 [Chrysophaeum taylorii]|uniref:Uncharacterized protein n=1 Tax=Chrysophaeum taylorii TaxID=2483200 RepID=A0AAD7XST4_9STRA|nr:hypothetical protein CTAYLR_009071 [Chrysophaeum taylorii]
MGRSKRRWGLVALLGAEAQVITQETVSAMRRALSVQRSLYAEGRGTVVGNDYHAKMSEAARDGSGIVPVRHVSAKDMARAERGEATATMEAEALVTEELSRGRWAYVPERGGTRNYPLAPGDPETPVGRMLGEAIDWSTNIRGAWDPVYARDELGMKGVKHFTEWLDLARLAVARGDDRARTTTLAFVRESVPKTLRDPGYHAWLTFPTDSWRFRQDSMSYLRAYHLCVVGLGMEASHPDLMAAWRRRIIGVLPRIWTHLETRGIDQKLNFIKLFRALNLYVEREPTERLVYEDDTGASLIVEPEEPLLPTRADLDAFEIAVFKTSLIWRMVPLGWYELSPERPYDITHEIFALTGDGRHPFPFFQADASPSPLVAADELPLDNPTQYYDYAVDTVANLLRLQMRRDALDVVCEYVVNFGQLGIRAERGRAYVDNEIAGLYLTAIDYIKARRNADGTFGESHDSAFIRLRKNNLNYDTRVGGTLHTTYVCLWALTQPIYDDDPLQRSWADPPPQVQTALLAGGDDAASSFSSCEDDVDASSSSQSSEQGVEKADDDDVPASSSGHSVFGATTQQC